MGVVKLKRNDISLGLPLGNNLVHELDPLLCLVVDHGDLVYLVHQVINLLGHVQLGLFKRHQLGVEVVHGALRLGQSGLQLQLSHLQLLDLSEGLSLKLVPPHVGVGRELLQLPGGLLLLLELIIKVLLDPVILVLNGPELAKQGLPLLGLVLAHPLGVIQLVAQGDLDLLQHGDVVQKFLQPGVKVGVLRHCPLVARFKLSQGDS